MVSFEYIIVAVCIIGAVSAVFGVGATGPIGAALTRRDHRHHRRFHCGHCIYGHLDQRGAIESAPHFINSHWCCRPHSAR